MPKVYEVWKGSNHFFCYGRFIFGPDVKSLLISILLITCPTILFCVFVASKFIELVKGGVAVLVIAILLLIWDMWFLLYTASRDPGIVPRNSVPPDTEIDHSDPEQSDQSMPSGHSAARRPPRTRDVIINGVSVKIKYCDTCLLYRPPRCSHCSICNNCVERFDHHCPWVGQCIGKRNYRYFFTFISSTTILCIFVFGICALYIKLLMDNSENPNHSRSLWKAMAKSPASIVLMGYTFIAVWFVGGLTILHIYLMSRNQTTYENFRYRYDKRPNPYNRGFVRNFYETLCSQIPQSKNNFRAEVRPASSSGTAPLPSRGTSRNRSQGSSGARSPVLKEAQQLEFAALVHSEVEALDLDLEKGGGHQHKHSTGLPHNAFDRGVCAGNAGEMAASENGVEDEVPVAPVRYINRLRWSGGDLGRKASDDNPRGLVPLEQEKYVRHREATSM